ncbi:VWA domain-containing protein [Rubrivirga sp. IMCC45206]|uniref:VWA domain-containing protein n=1 Tax=Rubrivirga sp. IMCC45206 TaxID=3391614 RepID=UPI00398FA6B6
MSFRSPALLLLAAVLVPAVVAAFAVAARKRGEALRLFLGDRAEARASALRPLARHRRIRAALLVGAVAAAAIALAGPRAGTQLREGRQESLDLLIALDVSDSMRAEDVAPSRLDRAKLEIERIVEARRGDRVGLVVFAGDAFLQSPLTTDRGALRLFLNAADPEQVGVQGTDFARALRTAEAAFDAGADNDRRPRALLVVSDGEDHEGGLGAAADRLRDNGVEILALGIGTDEGGPVPEVYRGRRRGVKTDRTGAPVVSRFASGALDELAGDGLFRVERRSAADAVNEALDRLDRAVIARDEVAAAAERFQWPLGLALLLLLAERLVALRPPTTRDDDAPASPDVTRATAPVAAGLALLVLSGCGDAFVAVSPAARAGRAAISMLADGDGEGAEARIVPALALPDLGRPMRANLWHTLGAARAAQERWAGADSAFTAALAFADTPAQRAALAADAGTAALLEGQPSRADSLLRVALRLDPGLARARRNQEIARRLIGEEPPPPPGPSDFARRLKAQADSLVAARQYPAALSVMQDGLARDSTVAAYADFIQRLGGVAEIETSVR